MSCIRMNFLFQKIISMVLWYSKIFKRVNRRKFTHLWIYKSTFNYKNGSILFPKNEDQSSHAKIFFHFDGETDEREGITIIGLRIFYSHFIKHFISCLQVYNLLQFIHIINLINLFCYNFLVLLHKMLDMPIKKIFCLTIIMNNIYAKHFLRKCRSHNKLALMQMRFL